ncbi:MAG TPA: hypothetical protein VIM27_06475, partial [Gaiellales bacterium]
MTVASHTGSDPIWRIPMPPRAAVRATIARGLFLRTVRGLRDAPLRVVLPDGAIAAEGRPGAPVMTITRDAFFHRLAAAGKIGFGEAYMAGDWTADDLAATMRAFAAHVERLLPGPLQRLRRLYEPRMPAQQRNTIAGAARNVA